MHPIRTLLIITVLLAALLTVAQSSAQPSQNSAEIIAAENAFWKAYIDANAADLSKLLLPDFTNVEEQLWNRVQVIDFVQKFHTQCTLAPVVIGNPHVSFLTPDIATIVYHAIETPKCGGRSMSGDTNISTVWLRRDGRWQMHLHTEYAIPQK